MSTPPPQQIQTNPTLAFIKQFSTRIQSALQQLQTMYTESPASRPSPLGYFQGLGLFSYICANSQQYKEKYPAFTDDQIVCILGRKWRDMGEHQKVGFFGKMAYTGQGQGGQGGKRLRKMEKVSSKIMGGLGEREEVFVEDEEDQEDQELQKVQELQEKEIINEKKDTLVPYSQNHQQKDMSDVSQCLNEEGKKDNVSQKNQRIDKSEIISNSRHISIGNRMTISVSPHESALPQPSPSALPSTSICNPTQDPKQPSPQPIPIPLPQSQPSSSQAQPQNNESPIKKTKNQEEEDVINSCSSKSQPISIASSNSHLEQLEGQVICCRKQGEDFFNESEHHQQQDSLTFGNKNNMHTSNNQSGVVEGKEEQAEKCDQAEETPVFCVEQQELSKSKSNPIEDHTPE